MKKKIEAYFEYKWKSDKNAAFNEEQDCAFYNQMPLTVKVVLMRDFMHKDFLYKFRKQFVFPNQDVPRKHAYYGWDDGPYIMFMFDVLKYLEPIMEPAGTIIQEQNEEVSEVTFFDFGHYLVGFEINKIQKFVMKFKEANVINAYACTYNQRSEWIYKTKTNCTGYFIRKKNWKNLFKDHYKIVDELMF